MMFFICWVALLAEGVDRNSLTAPGRRWKSRSPSSRRAWIEILQFIVLPCNIESPSSRRAWIEIKRCLQWWAVALVALLAEGVDRNSFSGIQKAAPGMVALLAEGVDRNLLSWWFRLRHCGSPSSRRAWIEMPNFNQPQSRTHGRPPRGGRG